MSGERKEASLAPQLSMMDVEDSPARTRGPRTVADVMSPDVLELHPDTSIREALPAFDRVGAAIGVVALGERIVGHLTRDQLEAVHQPLRPTEVHLRVGDVMTPQALTGRADWPIALAALTMEERHANLLPVLNSHGGLVGILFLADVKAALAAHL